MPVLIRLQPRLRLIRFQIEIGLTHQFPGGIRHGIHGCQHYGIGGVDISRCDAVPLVPDQGGDSGLAVAEVTCKGCERMTQHMRCDVGGKSTKLGEL
jgi:hypothetical protein